MKGTNTRGKAVRASTANTYHDDVVNEADHIESDGGSHSDGNTYN